MGNCLLKKNNIKISIEQKYKVNEKLENKIEEDVEEKLILDEKIHEEEEEELVYNNLEKEKNIQQIDNKYIKLIIKKKNINRNCVKKNKVIFYDSRLKKKIVSKIEYKIHRKSIVKFI